MGLGALHTVTLPQDPRKRQCLPRFPFRGHRPARCAQRGQTEAALERAKTVTFDHCAGEYIAAHSSSWKDDKHVVQWQNSLKNYTGPIIGSLPVAAVDTAMLMKVLQPIWNTKTETATRVRSRVENILDSATVSKSRVGENPARWRGHLENLLAETRTVTKVQHSAAFRWQEIGAFMADLRQRDGSSARAVEFGILTAARLGEVRGARWEEFDLDAVVWTVPAERMKAGRETPRATVDRVAGADQSHARRW